MASSSSRTAQTQTQVTNTSNFNLQDVGGSALVGDGNTVITSDLGAIEAAQDISGQALDLGRDALSEGSRVAVAGLDVASDAYGSSLTFAEGVSGSAFNFARDALDANRDLSRDALDAVSGAGRDVLDFASGLFGDALAAGQRSLDSSIGAVRGLATQVSSTTDDRNTKVAIYAVIAVAAAVALPAIFRGNK